MSKFEYGIKFGYIVMNRNASPKTWSDKNSLTWLELREEAKKAKKRYPARYSELIVTQTDVGKDAHLRYHEVWSPGEEKTIDAFLLDITEYDWERVDLESIVHPYLSDLEKDE